MAKDIEPAKRGDLVGHLSGERVECVAPIVRFLETSGQIPPVESGRSLAERPDTARIDRPAQQDTEIAPHPVAAEASRRPTQKQPSAPAPEHPTKTISADAPAFPQRPTDSLFMDPVVMTDDSFFNDGNLQAETPTLIEPSPATAANAAPSSAPVMADASDTVFDATLQPAPTLEGQDLSLETDLPSFSDDTGPPPEKGTDRVDKQPVEKPTTRVELRTDTKPPTTRRPDEVVRDTVNYYNQTTSLKDLLGSVVPQDTDTLNAGLPKEPLAPAVVAGGDFLNSDNLAPALPDDDDTDLSPTQTDARGPVTERIAAAPAPDIAPATDDAFETVGFDSADATRIDSALDFSEPPAPPAKPAAAQAPAAAASADLPMPDSVGGDFLSNDELPSAAGDRIIPELMMTGATTESAPAAPPPPTVAAKPAAPKPFVPAADFETVALNGRTVALPPPPSTPATTVRKVSPGRMPVVVPAKAATPPVAPPPAPKPAAVALPDARTELGLSTQALAAASKTPPSAPVRPPLGQREAVRPSTLAPSTPSVAPAAAKAPTPSPVVPAPVAAKSPPPAVVVPVPAPVAAKSPPPAVVAPVPAPVAAKSPPPAVVVPAPAPVAAKSPPPAAPAPLLPPVAAAVPATSSSGETTIIVEPAAVAAHAKAVAAVASVTAKPPTAPVRRPRPDHADTRRLIEKAEAVLAKLKGTSFIAPRRIAREETGRRATPLRTVEVAPREAVSVSSSEVPATAQARLTPQSGSVPLDELLLGSSPPRDTGSSSGFAPLSGGFDSPRRSTPRDPPPRDELPGHDMDIGELLAAASAHGESTVSRRRARTIPADDPPPPREEPSSHKMTSVLAKELDGMLRQMAENTVRESRSSSVLPAVPVQDKIAPAGAGETYLDGPLWWTLLGIAGISAFLTALFILIWFLLSKGGM